MIVIDTSAVVDVLTMAEGIEPLRTVMTSEQLHAPSLIDDEVVAALRGLAPGDKLSPTRAQDALADFADLRLTRWPGARELRGRAFVLRDNLSSYDAAFVVLAEALECPLITRDARLARSTGHHAAIQLL